MSVNVVDSSLARYWKRYPAYKDTCMSWLGAIPSHWQTSKTKYIFQLRSDKPNDGVDADFRIALENVEGWTGRFLESASNYVGEGIRFLRGDLLFGKLRPYLAKVFEAKRNGVALGEFFVMAPKGEYDSRFYFYHLLSKALIDVVDGSTYGAKMPRASWEFVGNLLLSVPPLDEQRRIVAFLDRETAKIDALIAKKERLIALLQEKRTALISHAVTKGLDPNVPMKDSESKWIAGWPSHWQVKQLKYVASLQTGLTLGKDYTGKQTVTRPYLRVANVQDGYLDLDKITEVSIPVEDVTRHELRPGDVLMTEGGDFDKLGRGYVWEGQIEGCLHQNHIFAVRPERATLEPRFLASLMTSSHGKNYFTTTSQQTTNLASTNSTKLRNFPLPLPPIEEQQTILAFLDRETAKIDTLITKVQQAIAKLREYRIALISAAVTGKIDVREENVVTMREEVSS